MKHYRETIWTVRNWVSQKGIQFWTRKTPFLLALGVALLSLPVAALANEKVGDFVFFWLAPPIYAYMMLIGGLLWVIGVAMTFLLNASFDVVNYLPVTVGWQTTRDVMNMIVVIILLVVIFATLFRVEAYYKNVLPKLILAVILVNFSRTITSILIEVSNVFTRSLMPVQLRSSFTETMLGALGVSEFWSIPPDKKFGSAEVFAGLMLNAVLFTVLFLALLGVALLFLFRLIALMFLTVLSPIAFVFAVLPATKRYANMWWESLTKWILYGPVAAFFLLLALRIAEAERNQILKGTINNYQQPFVQEGSMGSILVMILIICLIIASLVVAQKLGVAGAGAAMKLSKYGASYLGRSVPGFLKRFSTPNLIRQGARASSAVAGRIPIIGRPIKGAIDALRSGTGAVVGVADRGLKGFERTRLGKPLAGLGVTGLLRGDVGGLLAAATTAPQAIMKRMSRNSDEYYKPAIGRTRDAINALFGETTAFGPSEEAAIAKAKIDGQTGEELINTLSGSKNLQMAIAAAMEAANSGALESFATNPEAFNQFRDQLIAAARSAHDFSGTGEVAFQRFMSSLPPADRERLFGQLENPATAQAARDEINGLWRASNPSEFENAFSVTSTSAPVYTPEIMKTLLTEKLKSLNGGDEAAAARAVAKLSAIMGEKGNMAAFGMASYDPSTKTWSIQNKEAQRAIQEARMRRMGKNAILKSTTAASIASLDGNGRAVGLNGNADAVIHNLSASSLPKIGDLAREDLLAALETDMAGTGGKKLRDLITDRIRAQYAASTSTAMRAQLAESLAVVLGMQHASTGKASLDGVDLTIFKQHQGSDGLNKQTSTFQYKKIAEQFLAGVDPGDIERDPNGNTPNNP